jgi:hypothetical protein
MHHDHNADGFRFAKRTDTFLPGGVHMMEFRTPYRTRVVLEGPQPQIFKAVQDYYTCYSPQGYGTRQTAFAHGAGTSRHTLERANSCD